METLEHPVVPTVAEVMEAMEVLYEGRFSVQCGTWTSDMQEHRDRAHGVVARAKNAGMLPR